jgi:hypothetical protein
MNKIATAAGITSLLVLLLFAPGAQATQDEPAIPPSQECIDILAASAPKMFSTYFYDGKGHHAAYKKTVDAGCMPRNPIYYWIEYEDLMDYQQCLGYERRAAAWIQQGSRWAAPFYRQLMTIDRRGKKSLRPVRRKINALRFSKNKRPLKALLAEERRLVKKIRRQLFALGGKTVSRGARTFASGAIVVGDLYSRGCEIYQPFYYRQKNFYAAFLPSILRWMRTYRGGIGEREWRDWHGMVQFNAYPSFVSVNIPKRRWIQVDSGGIGVSAAGQPLAAKNNAQQIATPGALVPNQRPLARWDSFTK